MTEPLKTIEVQTGDAPRFSVIWLHGLGADGSDFLPVVPELGLSATPGVRSGVRFVFPNAPAIPVTCNGGWVMPAWYDILALDSHSRTLDEAGIVRTRDSIRQLIAQENRRGIPSERIFLAGFSQGGAMAYVTALTHPERLAGVIALSTYLPAPELIEREATPVNRTLPFFIAHGTDDGMVSPALGRRAADWLTHLGYAHEWHDYAMAHELCLEEVRDIGRWLSVHIAG